MLKTKSKGRVKNATKVDKYGLNFKSNLECYTYEAFIKAGIPVKYEPKHFVLVPKFEYNGTRAWNGTWTTNKKGKRTHSNTDGEFKCSPLVNALTYCPDFVGDGFIIECKGFVTESFPLRFKLFKRYLKQHHSNIDLYLVRNQKQIDTMVNEIKNKINNKSVPECQNL